MAKRTFAFCIRFERVECRIVTYDIEPTKMIFHSHVQFRLKRERWKSSPRGMCQPLAEILRHFLEQP